MKKLNEENARRLWSEGNIICAWTKQKSFEVGSWEDVYQLKDEATKRGEEVNFYLLSSQKIPKKAEEISLEEAISFFSKKEGEEMSPKGKELLCYMDGWDGALNIVQTPEQWQEQKANQQVEQIKKIASLYRSAAIKKKGIKFYKING